MGSDASARTGVRDLARSTSGSGTGDIPRTGRVGEVLGGAMGRGETERRHRGDQIVSTTSPKRTAGRCPLSAHPCASSQCEKHATYA